MPTTRKKQPPADAFGNLIDPTAVYVHAFLPISVDPATVIHQGDRFRGDHELVARFAPRFVPDGTPRSEWPADPDLQASIDIAAASSRADREARYAQFGRPQPTPILEPPPDALLTVTGRIGVRIGDAIVTFESGDQIVTTDWLLGAGDYITPTTPTRKAA